LARLLFAEAFALMAIVATVLQALVMMSDIGLGPNVIQSKRGDEQKFLNTIWTIQILRGTVLAVISSMLAWPVSVFYAANDPAASQLSWLIPLVAVGTFIQAFQSTKLKTANRHLSMRRITILQLGSQFCGVVVMVIVAWYTGSVYSMAIGGIVTAIVVTVLSHVFLPGENNRFGWERNATKEIFHFGKWILLSTVLTFISLQMDKLIFAKIFSLADVGVYGIASGLALVVVMLMGKFQLTIVFPLYSKLMDSKDTVRSVLAKSKFPILAIGGYMVALLIACSRSFIELTYDSRYQAAGIYLPILALGVWFTIVEGVYASAFLALGRTKWIALGNLVKIIIFSILIFPAARMGGIYLAIVCGVIAEFFRMLTAIYFSRKLLLPIPIHELLMTVLAVGVGYCSLNVVQITNSYMQLSALWAIVMQFMLVTLLFVPIFLRVHKELKGLTPIADGGAIA
jgi:O-antigen/teichoic acid export membrane protein